MSVMSNFVAGKINRRAPLHVGTSVASSLSGFIAGAIVASIVWAFIYYLRLYF